jgi:hypothetical protein
MEEEDVCREGLEEVDQIGYARVPVDLASLFIPKDPPSLSQVFRR